MNAQVRDLVYVIHIDERIARIEEIVSKGRSAFMSSHILQDAVIRNFEVIGEAAKHLSDSFKAAYPAVSWRRVAGFRDVLIHNYMGVDLEEVWRVVEQSLPDLKSAIVDARKKTRG